MSIHDRDPDAILFVGDWHGTLIHAMQALDQAQLKDIDTVIQLGDFGLWNNNVHTQKFLKGLNEQAKKRGITIYFVDGNHEDFNYLYSFPLQEDGTRRIRSNIFHLPRGFRFTWGGVRYVALGGAHSVDRDKRTPGVSWWPEEWVSDAQIAEVIDGGQADVMLMHDSPDGAPNPVVDDPRNEGQFYFSKAELLRANIHRKILRPAVEAVDPVLLFHGHYHRYQVAHYFQPSGTRTTVFSLDQGGTTRGRHMTTATREALQVAASTQRNENTDG